MAKEDLNHIAESFKNFYAEGVPGRRRPGDALSPMRFRNPIFPDRVLPFDPEEIRKRFLAGKTLDIVFAGQIDPAIDVVPGTAPRKLVMGLDDETGEYRFEPYYFLDELTPDGRERVAIQVEHALTLRQSEMQTPEPVTESPAPEVEKIVSEILPPPPPSFDDPSSKKEFSEEPSDELKKKNAGTPFSRRLVHPLFPDLVIPDPERLAEIRSMRGESLNFVFADEIDPNVDLVLNAEKYVVPEGPDKGRDFYFMDDLTPQRSAAIYHEAYKKNAAAEQGIEDLTFEAGRRIAAEVQGQPLPPSSHTFGQKIDALGERIGELPLRIARGIEALKGKTLLAGHSLFEFKKNWMPKAFVAGVLFSFGTGVANLALHKDPSQLVHSVATHFSDAYPSVKTFFIDKLGHGLHAVMGGDPSANAADPHVVPTPSDITLKDAQINQALSSTGIDAAHRHIVGSPGDLPTHPPHHPLHPAAPSGSPHSAGSETPSVAHTPLSRDPYERIADHSAAFDDRLVAEGHATAAGIIGEGHSHYQSILDSSRANMGDAESPASVHKIYEASLERLKSHYGTMDEKIVEAHGAFQEKIDANLSDADGHLGEIHSEGVHGHFEGAEGRILSHRDASMNAISQSFDHARKENYNDYLQAKRTLETESHHAISRLDARTSQEVDASIDEHYEEEHSGPSR